MENLAGFAQLALMVRMLAAGTATTAAAAALYFWSRLAHALIDAMGVPLLRTLAFLAGFAAQATMLVHLLGIA